MMQAHKMLKPSQSKRGMGGNVENIYTDSEASTMIIVFIFRIMLETEESSFTGTPLQ